MRRQQPRRRRRLRRRLSARGLRQRAPRRGGSLRRWQRGHPRRLHQQLHPGSLRRWNWRQDLAPEQDGYEACDDGNEVDGDGCNADCSFARCGDGRLDRNEQCDDGNRTNFDACTNACERARCGDGIIREDLDENDEGFEACDDNNANDQDAHQQLRSARCGDGIVRRDITNFAGGWEECDDGNIVQDDGCTRSCRYSSIADADGYIWDPTSPHGYLYNGTSDAWDGFGYLRVNNVAYRAGFESVDWARQVYTGQVHEMNGFRVTRRFYAARPNDDPNLRNFGRFYIRIENPSELPRFSVNIHLTGNLGQRPQHGPGDQQQRRSTPHDTRPVADHRRRRRSR